MFQRIRETWAALTGRKAVTLPVVCEPGDTLVFRPSEPFRPEAMDHISRQLERGLSSRRHLFIPHNVSIVAVIRNGERVVKVLGETE